MMRRCLACRVATTHIADRIPASYPAVCDPQRFDELSVCSAASVSQAVCLCAKRLFHIAKRPSCMMFCMRRKTARKPHPSFDLNGDGQVGQREYYLASRFDENRNGVLEPAEVDKAKRAFAQGFGSDEFRQYFSFNNLNLHDRRRVRKITI